MSDLEAAQQGATVAPAQNSETPNVQVEGSVPTNEQNGSPQEEQARDEKGRFVPMERFNQVYGKQKQAEREIAALRQQLSQIQPQQKAQELPAIPDPAEFGYDLNQWGQTLQQTVMQQAVEQARKQLSEQQYQEYQQRIADDFRGREEAHAATNPQYYENVALLTQSIDFQPPVLEALALSDHGPAIVDYLAQHIEEADRISRLPPHIAAVHLGRIEAAVSAPKPKPVSQAPAPAPTLKGGAISQKSPDQMTDAEWYAHERQQGRGSR